MNKRIILFSFLLSLLALPMVASAYDFSAVAPNGQTLYYNINSGTTTVSITYPGTSNNSGYYSGYTLPTGDLTIPSNVTYNGTTYSVTSIGSYAFYNCSGLTSVTIPNSVTSIGNYAFHSCSGLTSVTIGNSVTSIGDYAFRFCSGLTSVTIPNSVTSIGQYAFQNCSGLTGNLTIPNSVTSIGEVAFYNCSGLTSVTIGNSVTSIGSNAFRGCSGLTGSLTIPNSVTSIGNYAFEGCSGLTGSLTIPNSVTTIGEGAFYNCSGLTSVTIPNSVTSIGESTFSGCSNLTSVTIPNSVTSIGYDAFRYCSGLTSVTIPNSVTTIGEWAFRGCSGLSSVAFNATNCSTMGSSTGSVFNGCSGVTNLTIGDSVTQIPAYAFRGLTGLTSVTIPNSVTSIGYSAFSNCSGLTSVTIPNSVTSIGSSTFSGCSNLTTMTIPNSVTTIGDYAFYNCSRLTSVTIPNSVTTIGDYAFYFCSGLTSVTIGNSVTSIGSYAFYNCSGLTLVAIGDSVTSIGNFAFSCCINIDTIYMEPEMPPAIMANTFQNISTNIPVLVPCGTSTDYQDAAYWNVFTRIMEASTCDNTLTLTVNYSYMGSVRGNGMYAPGTVVEIMAVPQAGYHFLRWNDNNTYNPRTVTIQSDTSFTAIFDSIPEEIAYHNITVISANGSQGSGIGTGSYAHGTVLSIVAMPLEGYAFSNWNDGNTDNPRSITVTENNYYIANFVTAVVDTLHDTTVVTNIIHDTITVTDTIAVELEMYTLTVASANNSQGLVAGNGEFPEGTVVEIAAIPIEGHRFVSWNDNNTDNPRQVTLTENKNFIASFGTVGTDAVLPYNFQVYADHDVIVVENADGNRVRIFDAVGRQMVTQSSVTDTYRYQVPASGVYLIQVGDYPARKVTIVK